MGIWAGIKHALNSTLGTSEFKPLDKLMREYTDTKISYATVNKWTNSGNKANGNTAVNITNPDKTLVFMNAFENSSIVSSVSYYISGNQLIVNIGKTTATQSYSGELSFVLIELP